MAEAPPFSKAAVLGASGSTGRELVTELLARGVPTRVVSRSLANLRRNFAEGSVEFYQADLTDQAAMLAACDGCDMLFVCVGLPLDQYEEHITIARNLTQAMMKTRAKALLVSGYWSYTPIREIPVRETHLRRGGGQCARVRQVQEDLLTNAGACVAMLPDFYGPGAAMSFINDAIASLARGKSVQWPGDPAALRDFLFMPDIRPILINMAMHKEAFGQRWNIAGSGPIQPRQLLEMAADRLGERPRIRGTPLWMVKLAAKFSRKAESFIDLHPIYSRPAVMDGGALRRLIGEYHVTPYSHAIDRTLRWMTGGPKAEVA